MIQLTLARQLERVARRIQHLRLVRRLSLCWLAAAVLGGGLLAAQSSFGGVPRSAGAVFITCVALAGVLLIVFHRARRLDRFEAARAVEKQFPKLEERLLAAVAQQPHLMTGRLGYLQEQVVAETLLHHYRHNWLAIIPARRLALSYAVNLASLTLLITTTILLARQAPSGQWHNARRVPVPPVAAGELVYGLQVEPGDTSVERGLPLLMLARFAHKLPVEATLVVTNDSGEVERLPMTQSLDDPLFGGRIAAVDGDLRYRIEYDRQATPEYRVAVFDYPELQQADAVVVFPEYTELPETVIADTRQVTVVEGSAVTLRCRTNKAVAAARLLPVSRRGEAALDVERTLEAKTESEPAIVLAEVDGRADLFQVTLRPECTTRYRLELVDDEGRRNKQSAEFVIEVAPNRRPELTLVFPAKDLRVSPLEEVMLEAAAWDDFGLKAFGVIYALAGQEAATLVLGEGTAAKVEQQIVHQLALEELAVNPDDLVSYYFFADDIGPDGTVRRTYSDMFFAEVRHFEEIFRQGQQPPGGGQMQGGSSPQGQEIEKLAELEKQIVSATWKLLRRDGGAAVGGSSSADDSSAADTHVVRESQEAVLQQVREFEAKMNDGRSKALAAEVVSRMVRAVEALGGGEKSVEGVRTAFVRDDVGDLTGENPSPLPLSQGERGDRAARRDGQPLAKALEAERGAYQALLKLRAREHQVAQSQSSGGGGQGGGNRSAQQLEQLELSNKENRYEAPQQAKTQQAAANREELQVLNRLRELARRQEGVNEKLKELENELRLAATQEAQEEVRRRLKRLREEQQELLRDVDELRNRMDRPENQQRMADSRQQLDQTRSQVLQASDALKEGQVSRALTAGTRAERELEQMRDDFRRRAAGQFTDAMQDLRRQARELADRENQLVEKLAAADRNPRRSLRDSQERRELEEDFREQAKQLDGVSDRMRKIIQKAEQTEPLLSKRLYDALRNARNFQPQENLEAASQLVNKGLIAEASASEKQARRGVETLQQGVERAANAVLGNETDALKRARKEVKELSESLRDEVAQADREEAKPHESPNTGSPFSPSRSRPAQNAAPHESATPAEGPRTPSPFSPSRLRPAQETSSSEGPSSGGPGGPLTGANFQEFSDRLRDVEEMIDDPGLRTDVAKVRDRARSMRVEFKRHSQEPNWDLVRAEILEPLVELESRLAEQIARHESPDALVPIDRDPVPTRFSEMVRLYYERLGGGK